MSDQVKKYARRSAQFSFGGAGYGFLEILWRGYTHISMLIAGGICFLLLIRLSKSDRSLPVKALFGGMFITIIEFAAGCIVNLWLGLGIWDYSAESCQLFGQICLRFSLLWCLLCAAILPLLRVAPAFLRNLRVRRAEAGSPHERVSM